ncbi:MAG: hypothetical protein J6T80_06870 [Paludibacteraceae bacterium]|nr:hypothetical protein [Paludibacteraceae bacterium]
MKGQITVYYDLPNLALYLERVGNKVKEEHVQDIIAEMLKQAVALHMNEEADTISGTLMEMFVSSVDKTHTFENLPTDALRVYFGENEAELAEQGERTRQRTIKYLQRSASLDSASKEIAAELHREDMDHLVLRWKNRKKIEELITDAWGRIYERMNDVEESCSTQLSKEDKLIFLDFDGVLNSSGYSTHLYRNDEPAQDSMGFNLFDPKAVECMNRIVDATGAKIVVTSSWRYLGLTKVRKLWKERGLHGEIIGITSLHVFDELILEIGLEWLEREPNGSPRSEEIEHWLKSYGINATYGINANYVILDDLPMPKELHAHAVQVNPQVGLTAIEVKQAIQILNSK